MNLLAIILGLIIAYLIGSIIICLFYFVYDRINIRFVEIKRKKEDEENRIKKREFDQKMDRAMTELMDLVQKGEGPDFIKYEDLIGRMEGKEWPEKGKRAIVHLSPFDKDYNG